MSRRRLILIIIAILIVLIIAIILFTQRPAVVEVVQPVRRDVVELVIASGSLQAVRQSNIGSEVAGTVEQVLVREGNQVSAGQVLITLDRGTVQQQVEQAALAVQTAQRQLELASRPATQAQINRARAEVAQARRVNAARLTQAQERLRRLETGGRPEEIRRAQSALNQAQANLRQAEVDYQRAQQLFERGAIPRADLDRARTQLEVAQTNVATAREQLALARQPAAPEEIAAARAEVRAAQATLEESVRIAQESLRDLLELPRPEDVRVAQAQLQEARAALRTAQLEIARRSITAPFNGVIVERNVDPGQSVIPGQALMVIADLSRTEVVVETDETNLPRLRVGQAAILIPPAFPTRPFRGTVTKIGPEVDVQRGIVDVTIRPTALPDYARPDLTVDANIQVARIENALSVPATSLQDIGGRSYVLVVEDGRARLQQVRILARGERYAAVEGIGPNAQVITRVGLVESGERVRVVGGD